MIDLLNWKWIAIITILLIVFFGFAISIIYLVSTLVYFFIGNKLNEVEDGKD